MFLSLKQQVSNTNNDVSTFESKLNELKVQTDMAISFHNNLIKSDENIKIIVNTTTTNAFKNFNIRKRNKYSIKRNQYLRG